MDLLRWAVFIFAILWVIWFLTGGQYSGKTENPFLRPPSPLDTGETYGAVPLPSGTTTNTTTDTATPDTKTEAKEDSSVNKVLSTLKGSVNLRFGNARAEDARTEYVEIFASYNNTQPINITGWKLKSAISGKTVTIGSGVYLPFSGAVNREDNIFLNPGDRAIVTTGHSPKGVSFRLNTCTGYFEQFQDFTPALPQQCPRPGNEDLTINPGVLNDTCIDYIEQLPACFAHIKAIPFGFSAECSEYINKNIHYSGCLKLHKDDPGFYKTEWRIFLKRDAELWKQKRETIKLLDTKGKTIDSLSY